MFHCRTLTRQLSALVGSVRMRPIRYLTHTFLSRQRRQRAERMILLFRGGLTVVASRMLSSASRVYPHTNRLMYERNVHTDRFCARLCCNIHAEMRHSSHFARPPNRTVDGRTTTNVQTQASRIAWCMRASI